MGDIRQETVVAMMPQTLRSKYGDSMGTDIWRALQVVDRKDHAICSVLDAFDELVTDEQRHELVKAIWQRYYNKIAMNAIEV